MGRRSRWFDDTRISSFHIISKVTGGSFKLGDEDKEYFVNLMFKLARAYYVDISTFVVMSNHFHILLSNRQEDVINASKSELIGRYKDAFGKNAEHPEGSYIRDTFEIDYDDDGGTERLRRRLGSISRFVQDLKQRFSKWYNKHHKNHTEALWGNRFKSIKLSKGEAELICSAYIDLNPVRAGMVKKPEDYRWSGIGLRVRNQRKAMKLLNNIYITKQTEIIHREPNTGIIAKTETLSKTEKVTFSVYQSFVYKSGMVKRDGLAKIPEDAYNKSKSLFNRLGIGDNLMYRYRNISEGIAFGNYKLIADIQEKLGRVFIKPRKVIENGEEDFYSTRKLKPI